MRAALLLTMLVAGLGTQLGGASQSSTEADIDRAATLFREGQDAYSAAQYFEAIASFEEVLALCRAVGDRWYEAASLFYLGYCHYSLDDYRTAIDCHEQAAQVFREVHDQALEAESLSGLGASYEALGDYAKAIAYYEQAVLVFREVRYVAREAESLSRLGICHESLGDYANAIDYYERALGIRQEIGDRAAVAGSFSRLGRCYASLNRCSDAIEYFQIALAIVTEIGDRGAEAWILNCLGGCHGSLGDYAKAIDFYEESQAISTELGGPESVAWATSLCGTGDQLFSLGEYQRAIEVYERSLAIQRENGSYAGEALILERLGGCFVALRNYGEASAYLEAAFAIRREVGTEDDVTRIWTALEGVREQKLRCEESAQGLQDMLAAMGRISGQGRMIFPLEPNRCELLADLALTYEQLGQPDKAQESYEEAVQVAESFRSSLSSDEEMRTWWDRVDVVYWHLVDLLVREGQGVSALQFVERCRARTLLDLLAKGHTNSPLGSVGAGIQSGVVDAEQIQADAEAVRSSLPEDTVVVEYFVTDTASYVWVVTREGTSEPAILPYGNSELVDKVIACRQKIEGLDLGANRDLAELYDWLVRPVERLLPLPAAAESLEAYHLVIVPSGPLYYLPFQALLWTSNDRSQSARLVEQYAVSYAPSLVSLKYTQHQTSESEAASCFLGLADPSMATPRLPEAQAEVREVADAFTCSEVYVGAEATEEVVRLRSEQATFLLLSTHGMFNTTNPVFSYLVLDQTQEEDGKLCTYEVSSLSLAQTDLVVLSACETLLPGLEDMRCQIRATRGSAADEPITLSEQQLSDLTRGDELVGLTRAFLAAGASSVLSSLWAVPPAATASLVVAFYKGVEAGSDRAEALRLAQLAVMRTPGREQPWYWAAFNLVGDCQ